MSNSDIKVSCSHCKATKMEHDKTINFNVNKRKKMKKVELLNNFNNYSAQRLAVHNILIASVLLELPATLECKITK